MTLSVTQLAEFSCRQGDLYPDGVAGPTAKEGIRAHKRVQNSRKKESALPDQLVSELTVKKTCDVQGCRFAVSGRIDLVDQQKQILSEIKTTLVPAEWVPESKKALQWAQLLLYGYLYMQQMDATSEMSDELSLELIHINIRDNTEHCEVRRVSAYELEQHATQALTSYALWIKKTQKLHARLVETAGDLKFPFEQFRGGQRDMAAAVFRASRDSKALICEAPTGVGKTMSSLFPAVKSMATQSSDVLQLVYLTAKVAGRQSAEQAMLRLHESGFQGVVLHITAKDTACFCRNGSCELDDAGKCPMALGFYDRLPDAREEMLKSGIIDNTSLGEVAWAHQLCPYELCRQLLPWVHVVIADFNYVFDPMVRFAHFSNTGKNAVLLVDEAHNLVERSRGMYSAKLTREQCQRAVAECTSSHALLKREIAKLSRKLSALSKGLDSATQVSTEQPRGLAKNVSGVLEQFSAAMTQANPKTLGEHTLTLISDLCRYAVIDELFSEYHRCLITAQERNRRAGRQVEVSLFCVDASSALAKTNSQFRAHIAFSATLRPGDFYRDSLGFDECVDYLKIDSPFDSNRCAHCVVDWIDTRYQQRDSSIDELVALIWKSTELRSGNYLVFLPSYDYLEKVHALFTLTYPDCATWVQTRGQSKSDQKELLESLELAGHRIGFAIAGGVFGEGIDYKGDRLIGVIIVGTGLPARSERTELIAQSYRQAGRDGYEMAYVYPGFARVLQTAGRLIRHEQDKGFVLLVDTRFNSSQYRRLFPDTWNLQVPKCLMGLVETLTEFWAT